MISVLMSVCNEKLEWIQESIESILNQTVNELELIIINDNPSSTIIKKILRKYDGNSKVKILNNYKNLGLAKSLNKAFNISRGDYIARMDADDISLSDRFQIELEKFKRYPNIDFISANVLEINEDGELIKERKPIYLDNEKFKAVLKYGNISIHPTWLMKREVFENLKGYRPFPNSQDYDFLSRMVDSDFQMMNITETVLQYRIRSNNLGGIKQLVVGSYIKELNKERRANSNDSFNELELKKRLKISQKEMEKYNSINYYFRITDNSLKHIIIKVYKGIFYSKFFRKNLINRIWKNFQVKRISTK